MTRWTKAVRFFRSTWCVMNGGHFKLLHAKPNRLSLKCVACGYETPGWQVAGRETGGRLTEST